MAVIKVQFQTQAFDFERSVADRFVLERENELLSAQRKSNTDSILVFVPCEARIDFSRRRKMRIRVFPTLHLFSLPNSLVHELPTRKRQQVAALWHTSCIITSTAYLRKYIYICMYVYTNELYAKWIGSNIIRLI